MRKISIITVACGENSGLLETIASIDQQIYKPTQHLLVLSRIPQGQLSLIPNAGYRSAIIDQDKSLYHAMNLGLERAEGDLVLFLNGGDTLYRRRTLHAVVKKWDGRSIISGRSIQVFGGDTFVRPAVGRLNDLYVSAPHQSFFAPLSRSLPRYDESGRIGADSRWMAEVRKQVPQQLVADIICRFALGGLSNAPTLKSVTRRYQFDGFVPSIKEIAKLALHESVGAKLAYRLLYRKRFGLCTTRAERGFQFPE